MKRSERLPENETIFRDYAEKVIVYHNCGETPFVKIPHLHSQYELCYNIFGAESFFISGKFYACRPHDLFLIPKTQIHKLSAMQNVTYERCIINISPEVVDWFNSCPILSGTLSWMDKVGVEIPHRAALSDRQNIEFLRLCEEWNASQNGLSHVSVLAKLLSICGDAFAGTAPDSDGALMPKMWSDRVIAIIEKDFCGVTTADIAKSLFASEDYLCRIFRSETGISIGKYITLRRIAEAKRLLFNGLSVKEAYGRCGFGDYSSFIRAFKRIEGYPPGKLENLSAPI